MKSAELIAESWDVARALKRFGFEQSDLEEVAFLAASAKNESVSIDPVNAPGLLAYIYGTRALRAQLIKRGWRVSRDRNVEAVVHPQTGTKIVYQNTDSACDPARDPRAISAKGSAAEQMIEEFQKDFFPELIDSATGALVPSVWFFCVAVSDSQVRAELSCPRAVEAGQFKGFHERIFVVSGLDVELTIDNDEDDDIQDFDIEISRKQHP